MNRPDDARAHEARRTLDRLRRESEGDAPPPAPDDPAEVWARRTARALSVVVVIGLIAWLNGLI